MLSGFYVWLLLAHVFKWILISYLTKTYYFYQVFPDVPTPEMIGFAQQGDETPTYIGGERRALSHLSERLVVEENAFR